MTDAEKLADAKQKLHLLLTGQSPKVVVDQNGERVEFQMANIARLKAYIADLQGKTTQKINRPGRVLI